MRWEGYLVWSMWIIEGRYLSALSNNHTFSEVRDALMEKAEELGSYARNTPLILLNSQYLFNDQFEEMKNLGEPHISLVLE